MKKIYFILNLISLLYLSTMQGQILSVAPGTDFSIKSGTILSMDSLTLIPSANFLLNENGLIKKTGLTNASTNSAISQAYLFNNPTAPFSGTISFKYSDGAPLNGIPENILDLNNFNGNTWASFTPSSRDGVGNNVITAVNNINLQELTLAALLTPLSAKWQSFNAVKQSGSVLLSWKIAYGQNMQSFTVQHSSDNLKWQNIYYTNLSGNSNSAAAFSYVHDQPLNGNNFYRIVETDYNGEKSYSEIKLLKFTPFLSGFTILGNPVNHGILKVQVNSAAALSFYSNDGRLLFKKVYSSGLQEINVSKYAKGLYLLRSNTTSATILIQ